MYGIGTGALLLGPASDKIRSSILALSGDLDEGISYPDVKYLPKTLFNLNPTRIPTYKKIEAKRLAGKEVDTYWFRIREINTQSNLPNIRGLTWNQNFFKTTVEP